MSDTLYKAPPPDRVDTEMSAFIDWLNDKQEMPAPIIAAIAHLWFESIHPFSDGNGRVGRALIEYVFASRSRALPFSLSRQIEKDKKAYYAALQDGRKVGRGAIDATTFVVWFLVTLKSAADAGRDEAHWTTSICSPSNPSCLPLTQVEQNLKKFIETYERDQLARVAMCFANGGGIDGCVLGKRIPVFEPPGPIFILAMSKVSAADREEFSRSLIEMKKQQLQNEMTALKGAFLAAEKASLE